MPGGFVAVLPIRFGGRMLEPGDRVPVEPGRNYSSMVRLGQIVAVRDDEESGSERAPARSRRKSG
jgi:hypothetical protein